MQFAQSLRGEFVAPRNEVEERIASIYATILTIDQVSIHDNFFALGGDSLRATRVIAHLRAIFQRGRDFPIPILFQKPTVAELAEELMQSLAAEGQISERRIAGDVKLKQQAEIGSYIQLIPRRTIHERLPLSFTQERLWFLDQFEPHSALYNICWTVRLSGVVYLEALRHAFSALVMRHEILRTTFPVIDGTPYQVIAEQHDLDITVVDLHSWTEAEREKKALQFVTEESQRPFNLEHGPLMRVVGCTIGSRRAVTDCDYTSYRFRWMVPQRIFS